MTKHFKCPYVTVKAYSQVREYTKCPSRKRFDQYLSFRGNSNILELEYDHKMIPPSPLTSCTAYYLPWKTSGSGYSPSCTSSGCILQLCTVSSVSVYLFRGGVVLTRIMYRWMDRVISLYCQNCVCRGYKQWYDCWLGEI